MLQLYSLTAWSAIHCAMSCPDNISRESRHRSEYVTQHELDTRPIVLFDSVHCMSRQFISPTSHHLLLSLLDLLPSSSDVSIAHRVFHVETGCSRRDRVFTSRPGVHVETGCSRRDRVFTSRRTHTLGIAFVPYNNFIVHT